MDSTLDFSTVIEAEDASGHKGRQYLEGIAISMNEEYDVILGYPWLCDVNPDVDWPAAKWTYRRLITKLDSLEVISTVEQLR